MKLKNVALCFVSILFLLLFSATFILRGSLPSLTGTQSVSGLSQNVSIDRDKYGIPTIKSENRNDAAYATGFLHAQERFFQMDLMRRMAAGELSELFGIVALDADKEKRLHRLRAQTKEAWLLLSLDEQALLQSYTKGVNSGLHALKIKPFEYFVLRENPAPWKEEDSILVGLSLFFELQDSMGALDRTRGILKEHLSPEIYTFFTQNKSIWDVPLDRDPERPLQIPSQKYFKYLERLTTEKDDTSNINLTPRSKGSNQWAVAPTCTEEGIPFLACDMHLNLSVPNIWYRAALHYKTESGEQVKVSGVSLPGTPLIAVGSNQHLAWGFTNAYINATDLIILDKDPSNNFDYLTPEGAHLFEEKNEKIYVKGKPPVEYKINWTKWGPVHPEKFLGENVAIKWMAHDPSCFNFLLINLETSSNVADVLQSHANIRLPALNLMLVDKKGHIGWSYIGSIPKRIGEATEIPSSPFEENYTWMSCWEQSDFPQIIDPKNGRLWSANNRVLNDPLLGNDYLNSIRAYQIQKRLFDSDQHTVDTMYAIQLDDEAYFFERWFSLLTTSLDLEKSKHAQLQSILIKWDHHCGASSEGYFWIRAFREFTINRVLKKFLSPCLTAYPSLQLDLIDFEEPVFLIVSEQPDYLSPPQFSSWDLELTDIVDQMIEENSSKLTGCQKWGTSNLSQIKHPLGTSLSFLNPLLNMRKKPLAGDYYVPRLAVPNEGASIRLIVSPGHEQHGIFNMPCGQSGHPLSNFYRDQHKFWLKGKPAPLLPGEKKYTLTLINN